MRAKKSLGQNFLKSKQAVRSIIAAADIKNTDTILEIGPGKGVLTSELLKGAAKVIAIEKDDALIPVLREMFAQEIAEEKLVLIHADILEWKPEQAGLTEHSYKLVANIPYYITGALLRQFLESKNQPERMVLMLQKEVADRIVARDNKESLLSLSVKAYGMPQYIEKVAAKYFSPEPNVDSAIICIKNISRTFFSGFSEKTFFELIHAAFAYKRKQLLGNLKKHYPNNNIEKLFADCAIPLKSRAEDLPIAVWQKMAAEIAAAIMETNQYPQ